MKLVYTTTHIDYTVTGHGKNLLFLHGFLENKEMWHSLGSTFTDYQCIFPDLLGHGNTGSVHSIHTMEIQADMVAYLLKHLGIGQVTVIGHSMGGYVALALAEKYPEMVTGLVLLNSTSKADSEERKKNRDRAIQAVTENKDLAIRLSIANLFMEQNRTRLAPVIASIQQQALQMSVEGILAAQQGMKMRTDRTVVLEKTMFPKLFILGKNDGVLSYSETKAIAQDNDIPYITLDGGHMSHLENTEELNEQLRKFITQI